MSSGAIIPHSELQKQFLTDSYANRKEAVSFDPKAFKRDVLPEFGISDRVVDALLKEKDKRTKEDLSAIYCLIINLPGLFPRQFSSFFQYIKTDLAKILSFEQRDKGDVMVRQGETGYTFFVIVFGTAYVAVESETDSASGIAGPCNRIVATLKAGNSFGEIALTSKDSKRQATVVCREYCEVVTISKGDFDRVVRAHYDQANETKKQFFAQHRLFRHWTEDQLDHLAQTSVTEEFAPAAVIQQSMNRRSDSYIYFILKGRCKVIQPIQDVHRMHPGHSNHKRRGSWAGSSSSSVVWTPSKRKWWQVRTLEAGDYFGVGEGDSTMSMITDLKVLCIKVQEVTLQKLEKGKIESMRMLASRYYPTYEQCCNLYSKHTLWIQYKMSEVSQIAQMNRKPHPTRVKDVPRVLVEQSPAFYIPINW